MIDPDTWLAAIRSEPSDALILADYLDSELGDERRARRLRTRFKRYRTACDRPWRHYAFWRTSVTPYARVYTRDLLRQMEHQDRLFVQYVARLLEEVTD